MRSLLLLLLLAAAAAAQPPVSKDFRRMRELRDAIARRIVQLQEEAEFAKKPREEKMLIAFEQGERFFVEGRTRTALKGDFVVKTCLLGWDEVQRAEPTEAGKRVLALLPEVLARRYASNFYEVPKEERYDASQPLLDALDSDFLHVRIAAIESLKRMYRTQNAWLYEPTMDRKERRDKIEKWRQFVKKQRK